MKFSALYIHIPFCLRKCNYCDFVSVPLVEHRQEFAEYADLLVDELRIWGQEADFSALRSIYFGGGTPSLLPPAAVAAIIDRLPTCEEITLELNPETVDAEYFRELKQTGVNRLSIGAQSFDDTLLKSMGRGHNSAQTLAAFAAARAAGFANIGLDLIYGLPEQTFAQWQHDLHMACALEPKHISLYGLTVEDNTPWGKAAVSGNLKLIDDDVAADMAEYAIDFLKQAGFHHYEIANFSKPGYESKHNTAYWQRDNYLGLGVAAASCCLEHRWSNSRCFSEYADAIRQGYLPQADHEYLNIEEILAEAMFLGLRMLDGIDLSTYQARYGIMPQKYFKKQVKKLIKNNLVEIVDGKLKLTDKGVLLGNEAFIEFV